jgi:hypothetical protein
LAGPSAAPAADLIEPFDPGFTDLELYWAGDLAADERGASGLIGFGLGHGLSLGVGMSGAAGDVGTTSVSLVYSRSLGRGGELDAWFARGISGDGAGDLEAGVEWSRDFAGTVPYARLAWRREDAAGAAFVLGLALDRRRVDLHFELAAERDPEGAWPLRLAVGPNVRFGAGAEAIPELALVRDPATGDLVAEVSLGIVLCPRSLGLR